MKKQISILLIIMGIIGTATLFISGLMLDNEYRYEPQGDVILESTDNGGTYDE